MGLTMGKIIFGRITVDTPKHEVLHAGNGYEIRKYPPCVSAEVTYDSKDTKRGRDGALEILADYVGAFGKPRNTKPEKMAVTAPVITSSDGGKAEATAMTASVISSSGSGSSSETEAIAMTAPVITSAEPEPVAMTTAPVTTAEGRESQTGKVTMQFLLPSKYTKVEETPRPMDERVVLREVGERKYGVARFAGLAGDKVVAEKAERLKAALEKDGHVVKGPYLFSRYNPPQTLPPLRTNEVMFPVE
uniref:Uncharacterized protein n=1 Tax=Avena sativa TaxID=4498 RepID=A0ACD5XAT9_AVESA